PDTSTLSLHDALPISILPNSNSTPIYFETVNLSAVEVRVIQVFQDNMLQYLQNYNLDPDYDPDLRPVGRRVAYKLISLAEKGGGDRKSTRLNSSHVKI